MPDVFDYHHAVRPDEIDELGHVGNLFYLQWAVDAAVAHSACQGWDAEAYRRAGCAFVVRSHQIEYSRPALPGDEIIVRTWVAGFRKASSLRRYKILRPGDNVVLARAATDWAYIKLATGMPTRIPAELQQAFTLVDSLDP
jgi:acyl-CoA thioester hydrolase